MFFSRRAGIKYVDRGDAPAHDYIVGDFTKDNDWHTLDLSGVVGVGRRLVSIHIHIASLEVPRHARFATNGNTDDYNIAEVNAGVSINGVNGNFLVYTDADGKIQYKFQAATWFSAFFAIRGWFIL